MRLEIEMTFKQCLGLVLLVIMLCIFVLLLRPAIDWELDDGHRRVEARKLYYDVCVDGDQPFDNGEW